jgi:TetR/AcrR family transcriptional repressor of mexJK operon
MSAISPSARADDPRVVRTRAAVRAAAQALFLEKGYAGTTMDDIAAAAGIARRTLYNNYPDKAALFTEIVAGVTTFAETFVEGLRETFAGMRAEGFAADLEDLGRRLALGILRPEVIALRRLLIGEAREFPAFAADYFDRAPGRVMDALAEGFAGLDAAGLLKVAEPRLAAAQYAYLIAGEHLDRAMLTGEIPPEPQILAGAREGLATFLARYQLPPPRRGP